MEEHLHHRRRASIKTVTLSIVYVIAVLLLVLLYRVITLIGYRQIASSH